VALPGYGHDRYFYHGLCPVDRYHCSEAARPLADEALSGTVAMLRDRNSKEIFSEESTDEQINCDRALETLKKLISYPHPQHDLAKVRGFIAEVVKPVIARLPFDDLSIGWPGNLIAVKKGQSADPPLVVCTYGGSYPAENMPDPYTPKIVDGEPYGLNGPACGAGARPNSFQAPQPCWKPSRLFRRETDPPQGPALDHQLFGRDGKP